MTPTRCSELKRRIEAGQEVGPRVFMSGIMEGPGPFAGPTKVLIDNEAQAREAVDNYAKLGYQGVKIYSSIKPELVPVIAKLAHEKGLRVGGHVPANMNARQFIEAGADEMQHINFVFLNFFFDEVKDTRTPARFTTVAQRASKLDLNSTEVRSFVQLMKDQARRARSHGDHLQHHVHSTAGHRRPRLRADREPLAAASAPLVAHRWLADSERQRAAVSRLGRRVVTNDQTAVRLGHHAGCRHRRPAGVHLAS